MNPTCPLGVIDLLELLNIANWVLVCGGGVVVATSVAYWSFKVRRDPLAGVPDVPNRLMPETVLLPVLVWLFVGGLCGMLAEQRFGDNPPVVAMLWIGNAAQLAGAGACLLVATKFFDGGARRFLLGQERIIHDVGWATAYLMAAIAVCPLAAVVTLWLITSIDPNYAVFEHQVIDAMRAGDIPLWVLWIGAAVVAPIAEECFFRGILQTYLVKLLHRRWAAILTTGILFGAVHAGGNDAPQPHVVPAMVILGVLLGVLYARSGSLIAPIALHALFNLKTLAMETALLLWG